MDSQINLNIIIIVLQTPEVFHLSLCVCIQILFVLVNVNELRNGRLMEYFRVRGFEAPLIRLVNLTNHVTYHLPSDTLDEETIKTFCQSYLEGKAKVTWTPVYCVIFNSKGRNCSPDIICVCMFMSQPKMQSEPILDGWDKQPVKQLVGMNLETVAFNPNKTVFVLFCMYTSSFKITQLGYILSCIWLNTVLHSIEKQNESILIAM